MANIIYIYIPVYRERYDILLIYIYIYILIYTYILGSTQYMYISYSYTGQLRPKPIVDGVRNTHLWTSDKPENCMHIHLRRRPTVPSTTICCPRAKYHVTCNIMKSCNKPQASGHAGGLVHSDPPLKDRRNKSKHMRRHEEVDYRLKKKLWSFILCQK